MSDNSSASKEIHRVLSNTIISPEMYYSNFEKNDVTMGSKLRKVYDCLDRYHPLKLFRYRNFSENSVSAFCNDQLFLTRADRFNDPYDCFLRFDKEQILRNARTSITKENILRYHRTNGLPLPVGGEIKSELDYYKFIDDYREDFLKYAETCFAEVTKMLQENMYIACFCEDITTPVMWAHYSDNHKGFAIEYQFSPEMFYPRPLLPGDEKFLGYGWRSILPVYYSTKCPDGTELAEWYAICRIFESVTNVKNADLCAFLPDMLLKTKLSLQKSNVWAYEREWRMLLSHEYPNNFGEPRIHFIFKPTAVYIGTRTSEEDRNSIISIARSKNISVYEMIINNQAKEYKLDYRPVE